MPRTSSGSSCASTPQSDPRPSKPCSFPGSWRRRRAAKRMGCSFRRPCREQCWSGSGRSPTRMRSAEQPLLFSSTRAARPVVVSVPSSKPNSGPWTWMAAARSRRRSLRRPFRRPWAYHRMRPSGFLNKWTWMGTPRSTIASSSRRPSVLTCCKTPTPSVRLSAASTRIRTVRSTSASLSLFSELASAARRRRRSSMSWTRTETSPSTSTSSTPWSVSRT
mmetsp:Transcript_122218/g.260790  ORF Transcript_122218/g.260790 Transcript_122218/m.260790 type:complete len:220 (+) Transcript_122218:923-1582(+)